MNNHKLNKNLISKLLAKSSQSTSQPRLTIKQQEHTVECQTPPLLPELRDDYGAMPVVMALARLFHSHRVNHRVEISNQLIANYKGQNLIYVHGERLTYIDEELLMALFLIYSRTNTPLTKNDHVRVRISELREFLGWTRGGKNNEKIYSRLEVMRAATFALCSVDFDAENDQGTRQTFNILSFLKYDRGEIEYALDPKWSQIFSEFPLTLINLEERLTLSPHARVIHRLLSTSKNARQSFPESRLFMFIGWEGSRIHDFWYAMRDASQELQSRHLIKNFTIYKSASGERIISYVVNQAVLKPRMGRNRS